MGVVGVVGVAGGGEGTDTGEESTVEEAGKRKDRETEEEEGRVEDGEA